MSATTHWRRCGYWRQAYGGLGTPPVHITLHERPRGRGKKTGGGLGGGAKKKSNLANLKLHSPTTEDSSSLCTLSLFFAFPSALFSIRKALFLNLLGGPRGQLWKRRRRGGIISPCHIFNLPYTHTHTEHTLRLFTDTHTLLPPFAAPLRRLSHSPF